MKTAQYLDALKAKLGLETDYALAKRLKIATATMSNYRNGKRSFDDEMAARVAKLLELDALTVLVDMQIERAQTAQQLELWKRLAKKVAAVMMAPAIAAAIAAPSPAEASMLQRSEASVYYVKSRRWLWLLGLPGFADDDERPA